MRVSVVFYLAFLFFMTRSVMAEPYYLGYFDSAIGENDIEELSGQTNLIVIDHGVGGDESRCYSEFYDTKIWSGYVSKIVKAKSLGKKVAIYLTNIIFDGAKGRFSDLELDRCLWRLKDQLNRYDLNDTVVAMFPLDQPYLRFSEKGFSSGSEIIGYIDKAALRIQLMWNKVNVAINYSFETINTGDFFIPSSVDWVGFSCYGPISDCHGRPIYGGEDSYAGILSKRMHVGQKFVFYPQAYIPTPHSGALSTQGSIVNSLSAFELLASKPMLSNGLSKPVAALILFRWNSENSLNGFSHVGVKDLPIVKEHVSKIYERLYSNPERRNYYLGYFDSAIGQSFIDEVDDQSDLIVVDHGVGDGGSKCYSDIYDEAIWTGYLAKVVEAKVKGKKVALHLTNIMFDEVKGLFSDLELDRCLWRLKDQMNKYDLNDTVVAMFPLDEPYVQYKAKGFGSGGQIVEYINKGALRIHLMWPGVNVALNYSFDTIKRETYIVPASLDWVGFNCYGQFLSCNGAPIYGREDSYIMKLSSKMHAGQQLILYPQTHIPAPLNNALDTETSMIEALNIFEHLASKPASWTGIPKPVAALILFRWHTETTGSGERHLGARDLPAVGHYVYKMNIRNKPLL
ncbi:hypothetical protein [Hahella sp. NBU794]|uniref:hypothetical protein n=1 Tax=Hahella sp. NBU794 TaxID=3422590 RepID=UPI003D6FBB17